MHDDLGALRAPREALRVAPRAPGFSSTVSCWRVSTRQSQPGNWQNHRIALFLYIVKKSFNQVAKLPIVEILSLSKVIF